MYAAMGFCISMRARGMRAAYGMSDAPRSGMDMDRKLISLREDYEVRYWTQAFGVTKKELMDAVQAVGHSAGKVREYLESRRLR